MSASDDFNKRTANRLPGHLGIVITEVDGPETRAELKINPFHMAPNGYMHAGTVVAFADTGAGCGCLNNLPDGAVGFTTIELKSNHLSTAREGTLECRATAKHLGRSTQVWDADVTHKETGKVIAIFRCTQLILYDKPASEQAIESDREDQS